MTQATMTTALRLILAALVLHLLLIQPNHPAAMTWRALILFPLELPVILLGLAAIGTGRVAAVLRGLLVAALTLIAAFKGADFAMFTAFARGFNPVADLPLAEAGVRLLAGSAGPVLAGLAVLAALAAVVAIAAAAWWATGVWAALAPGARWTRVSAGVAVFAAVIATADAGNTMRLWSLPADPPGAAFTSRVGVERVAMIFDTLAELRTFRAEAASDRYAGAEGLLDVIDRDVLVIFVESYGRTSLDTPYFAEVHRPTLQAAEARLSDLGLSMRSGLLEAPTKGGQSWLSHATFANGLWVDGQTRHGAILASGRETLFHLAGRSGFHTAAVMPQITLDWPESATMGFETVLPAADLGYAGKPFNWVTMPDQFTLAALDRMLRDVPDDRPLFAQVALASSHAPWVPVPELVDWDAIGDGRIFDEMATAGDTPEVVWRDRDRVREQYRLAIDYALRTVFDYAARHAETPPLIIIVGDHQAAGFVALDDRPDVPVHVIGPEHLVARVADWGWQPGLVPATNTPVLPMDRMRGLIVDTFSTAAPAGDAS
jgi:energy-converting hydrogenase Eha subunit A